MVGKKLFVTVFMSFSGCIENSQVDKNKTHSNVSQINICNIEDNNFKNKYTNPIEKYEKKSIKVFHRPSMNNTLHERDSNPKRDMVVSKVNKNISPAAPSPNNDSSVSQRDGIINIHSSIEGQYNYEEYRVQKGAIYSEEFESPKNVRKYIEGDYVSFDNKIITKAARLISMETERIGNIYDILDYKEKVRGLFKYIRAESIIGLKSHNSIIDVDEYSLLELIVINTNLCCSKSNLLHIQLYSDSEYAPYNEICIENIDLLATDWENNNFEVKKKDLDSRYQDAAINQLKIILMKDSNKSFKTFLDDIITNDTILTDYIDILKKFKDDSDSENIRSFIVPNDTNSEKYKAYELSGKRFAQLVYICSACPMY